MEIFTPKPFPYHLQLPLDPPLISLCDFTFLAAYTTLSYECYPGQEQYIVCPGFGGNTERVWATVSRAQLPSHGAERNSDNTKGCLGALLVSQTGFIHVLAFLVHLLTLFPLRAHEQLGISFGISLLFLKRNIYFFFEDFI